VMARLFSLRAAESGHPQARGDPRAPGVSVDVFPGVIRAAHQRAGFDVAIAEREGVGLDFRELFAA